MKKPTFLLLLISNFWFVAAQDQNPIATTDGRCSLSWLIIENTQLNDWAILKDDNKNLTAISKFNINPIDKQFIEVNDPSKANENSPNDKLEKARFGNQLLNSCHDQKDSFFLISCEFTLMIWKKIRRKIGATTSLEYTVSHSIV